MRPLQGFMLALAGIALAQPPSLPVVNLGYQRHQALSYNATGDFYRFANIRYAASPAGNNRWREPQPPKHVKRVVKGNKERICPQATPGWISYSASWIPSVINGTGFQGTQEQLDTINATKQTATLKGTPQTEDCLFLDVYVPKNILNSGARKAPVLVWIYGGGYTAGSKNDNEPSGLLRQSQLAGREGLIFVTPNYRLGAFGFLAGPTLQKDGIANAGLYDQRYALQWVQKHIGKFGGDASRVTVMGESAGGGSIFHQITAFGGKEKAPFQQAILQSPAWQLQSPPPIEDTFQNLLNLTKTTSVAQLRQLNSQTLAQANLDQIYRMPYSLYNYEALVDGVFTPEEPFKLLAKGAFDKTLNIMVGRNKDEGLLFSDPLSSFNDKVPQLFPLANKTVLDYIEQIYPPDLNGPANYTYSNEIARQAFLISESTFTCNAFYLHKAFQNKTHGYIFGIEPSLHGQDVSYSFNTASVKNTDTYVANSPYSVPSANIIQSWITTFVQDGKPSINIAGVPNFPQTGAATNVLELQFGGKAVAAVDPIANARCNFWQEQLYV